MNCCTHLGILGDVGPDSLAEVDIARSQPFEHYSGVLVVKGVLRGEQDVHDDSKAPHVDRLQNSGCPSAVKSSNQTHLVNIVVFPSHRKCLAVGKSLPLDAPEVDVSDEQQAARRKHLLDSIGLSMRHSRRGGDRERVKFNVAKILTLEGYENEGSTCVRHRFS